MLVLLLVICDYTRSLHLLTTMECDEDKCRHIILLACVTAMHAARPVKMVIPSTFATLAPLVIADDSQSKPHPEQGVTTSRKST